MIQIEISDTQGHVRIDHETMTRLARRVLAEERRNHASISIALVDNATIHGINCRHLDHDWPTDVISFALSEPGESTLIGEIVISGEMALMTGQGAGLAPRDEMALYLVHGLLHLCGFDDGTDEARDAMRRREREILAMEGITNTFVLVGLEGAAMRDLESVRWSV